MLPAFHGFPFPELDCTFLLSLCIEFRQLPNLHMSLIDQWLSTSIGHRY